MDIGNDGLAVINLVGEAHRTTDMVNCPAVLLTDIDVIVVLRVGRHQTTSECGGVVPIEVDGWCWQQKPIAIIDKCVASVLIATHLKTFSGPGSSGIC